MTGKVRVKKLKHLHNDTIERRELNYKISLKEVDASSELELL